jgi:hypothetical protein
MSGIDEVLGGQSPEQQARLLRALLAKSISSPSSGAQGGLSFPATLAMQVAMSQVGIAGSGQNLGATPQFFQKEPVVRVSQMNPAEYDSPVQARTWGPVSCSAAALTSALRSFGVNVRIADVLREMPGAVSLDLGLVSRPSLVDAARRFGVEAREDVADWTQLERATAAGQPVLADVVSTRFPEGHWMVVTSAGPAGVQLADSSGFDLKSMTREEFLACWAGRGIRMLGPGSRANG